jgi:ribosomal protein S18 acetylase RimI-like enzyme
LIPSESEILEAQPEDAAEIADLYLAAQRAAMPNHKHHLTDDELRDWFLRTVGTCPGTWWIARWNGQIIGYMAVRDEDMGHLYVRPDWQGRGVGSELLDKAKELSPRRLTLSAARRNARARAFYEARHFRALRLSDDGPHDADPDVHYVWRASP